VAAFLKYHVGDTGNQVIGDAVGNATHHAHRGHRADELMSHESK
jgi:hypothetical protein